MKLHAALVSIAIALVLSFAVPAARANVRAVPPAQVVAPQTSTFANRVLAPSPAYLAVEKSPAERHVFPVNDEKGLLLTCVAPEIDTNKDTDVFKDCELAPGRSLDDVMHSFIGAMHEEERKLVKEQAESTKDADDKSSAKAERR